MSFELDREVGERLGYRAACIDVNPLTDQRTWCLLGPDNAICDNGQALSDTEENVWHKFFPRYSEDIETALTLVPESTPERVFMLRQYQGKWLASITDLTLQPDGGAFEGSGDTPAEAICRAWLEWEKHR